MLQISSGKFFVTDKLYVTRHRGVLYTNYHTRAEIETSMGALRPLTEFGDVASLLYDGDERLEAVAPDGRPEFLASVGGEYMIQDFSAVASFGLRVTCSPDRDLVTTLTQLARSPLGSRQKPLQHVQRVFEPQVAALPEDGVRLQRLVSDLVGLERPTYEATMRAIRRFVTGLHRVGDDLDLAYTMLVASVESLAQTASGPRPKWSEVSQGKREAIDRALNETRASAETRERVRDAVLQQEHVALARRYREFALTHVTPSFFREEVTVLSGAAQRNDLPVLLDRAYAFRSSYVHTLRELPRIMSAAPSLGDVVVVDGRPHLSIQGIARLAHHVITTFVARAPKVLHESFDYRSALPNIVRMQLAESYWLGNAEGFSHRSVNRYLNGFMNQLASVTLGQVGAELTDLEGVMRSVEQQVPGLAEPQRRPMLALYAMYYSTVRSVRSAEAQSFLTRNARALDSPSIESALAHVILSEPESWAPAEWATVREKYFKQRRRRDGILLPPVLEAGLTLTVAERFRSAGDDEHALRLLAEAVENMPGHPGLIALEKRAIAEGQLLCISWRTVLLPPTKAASSEQVTDVEQPNQQ